MADRLFISHASEDEGVVNRIVAYLEAHGATCWISSRDIPPRAIYADAIAEGIQVCTACVVIVSAAANASKAVKRELELASHEDKPFIPIRIDETEPAAGLAYYLRNAQWVDYARQGERALDRIVGQKAGAPVATAPIRPERSSPPRTHSAAPPHNLGRIGLIAIAAIVLFSVGWLAWSNMTTPHTEVTAGATIGVPDQADLEGLASGRGTVRIVLTLLADEGRMIFGSGSGFIVAPNLIVTSANLVSPANQNAEVQLWVVPSESGGPLRAQIIRYSPERELALLEFVGPELPAMTISTFEPRVGGGVTSLSYPLLDLTSRVELVRGVPATRTYGAITSLRSRAPTGEPIPVVDYRLLVETPGSPRGTTGGPILDDCGRVIGVSTWQIDSGDSQFEPFEVATRAAGLAEFLATVGIAARVESQRCSP